MTVQPFITSRQGQVEEISLHKYFFSEALHRQPDRKRKFCNWLRHNPESSLYDLKENCFFTLTPLEASWQYYSSASSTSSPPFENTSLISNYLGKLIRKKYSQHYEQFLNENVFVICKIELPPFCLLKCFQFNVEVFPDGEFYIHLMPISKIVGSENVNEHYLRILKHGLQDGQNNGDMSFAVVDCKFFKRWKLDMLDVNLVDTFRNLALDDRRVMATFDYHFVSSFSRAIFGQITENTTRNLEHSIKFLIPISEQLDLQESIVLHDKPFYRIDVNNLAHRNNLMVGNGVCVN